MFGRRFQRVWGKSKDQCEGKKEKTHFFHSVFEFLTARISFQFQSNYCNIHKSTRHWDATFPPCCHLSRVDNKLKCCGANTHTHTQTYAGRRAHTDRQMHVHTRVKQAFGSRSVSEKQRVGVSEQLQEPWGGLGLTASSEGLGEA